MNWKAIARRFREQRDECWADKTKTAIERALEDYKRRNPNPAEAFARGLESKTMNDSLLRLVGVIDADHFRRMMDGYTNIGVILHVEFERRFPDEFAKWMKEIES